ncbi:MAG: pyridoxamine 5'-phosphate oxidase family protein [Flavisolibacter sp.]
MNTPIRTTPDSDAISKFRELVKDVNICMFTTIDENQQISSRPMFTTHIDEEGNVWFFTNEFSEKINEVSKDNIVNLIYSHPPKNIYANVRGTCSLVIDRNKMEELWTSDLKRWFPEGLEDPKICLVKVSTESAYYWNHSSSKMRLLFQMLRSITKGDSYQETESGKLDLTPTQPEM